MVDRVKVSRRALLQRLNRVLARSGHVLKKSRPTKYGSRYGLGDYYVVDLRANVIRRRDVDIRKLARRNGVLAPWERLERRARRLESAGNAF
jgi:hypothetical protein